MYTVQNILNMFIDSELQETMGNWYPRVCAVMSCVIPTMYIAFIMVCVAFCLYALWRFVSK
jgi:hypothetical protein